VTPLRVTLGSVARAVGGTLRGGDADREVGEIGTDSRAVQTGDLFIALRGPRFDAHDFVAEVLAKGAFAIVDGEADLKGMAGAVIEVGDTLKALQDLAHAIRTEAATRVMAITGSAGKTTTKETIAAFLRTRLRVVKNK
jgi:UDP-N-acetylmuramoyl-tripeptide--D-alanyl-D-alanine ligase